ASMSSSIRRRSSVMTHLTASNVCLGVRQRGLCDVSGKERDGGEWRRLLGSRQEAGRITAHARAAVPTAISGLVQPDSRRPYYAYQVCRPFVSFVTFVSFISERSDPKGQIPKVRSER